MLEKCLIEITRWLATLLIIGDDTVDVPFFFQRPAAVSFAPYPYTDHPDYQQMMAYVTKHCPAYQHIYLILHDNYQQEEAWRRYYGSFIADIVFERLQIRIPVYRNCGQQ